MKEAKAALSAELNRISDAERWHILSEKMPSYVSSYSTDFSIVAILDACRELPAAVPVTKKLSRKCTKFFLECYDSDYITRKDFLSFVNKLMEEIENE